MPYFRSLALGVGVVWLLLVAPAHAVDQVIGAAGDISCDPNGASFNGGLGDATHCRQKFTSDQLLAMSPDAVLPLGDTQYEDGTLAQFQGSYDLSWGRLKSITHPAIGNHEYQNGSNGVGYFDYFNGVGNATGAAGDRDKGYYSFNVTDGASVNWHVIALNSMCLRVGGCGAGSAQEQWLRADLAANSDPAGCTIAYWHHPLFNSGPDGNYNDDPQNNTIALWQALFEAGADLVLSGHAHFYQRYGQQDAAAVANAFGLREFVVGTGGASLVTPGPTQPNLETRDNTKFGVLKLVLKASGYDWSFVSDTGATSDPGSASCHGAPTDTAQPETSISAGPDGVTSSRDAGFAFASSEAPATFRCRLDGPGAAIGTDAPCPSSRSFTGLADGAYTFSVYARDPTGNVDTTPATRSFTVDGTAPLDTSITDGPSGTISTTSATFTFGPSESGAALECRLDGAAFASCSSPTTYDGLAEGPHTFETRAIDAAGNTDPTPATRSFTVDTIAPDTSIILGPDGVTTSRSVALFFAASEGGTTFECRLDRTEWASCGSPQGYDGLAHGPHRFEARAIDMAGNADATPAARTFMVDTTPPDRVFRAAGYEILAGRVHRGRGAKRRLYVDDGSRLEIRGARKRSGPYRSAFRVLVPIGAGARDSLRSLAVTYNGGTSARNATAKLYVFKYRTRRWVKVFEQRGRRDRSFDWSRSASARDYVSSKGVVRVRVTGSRRGDPFRTRTDLVEVTVGYLPAA